MANLPITTLVPFSTLPACAQSCGPLYDANGACVPPNVQAADPTVYDNCFCSYTKLAPFVSTTAGVCDTACTATPADLGSIQGWFTSFCAKQISTATASTSSAGSTGGSSSGSSSDGSGGDWLSTHWKWVIMIVVVVVGIAGIWIGACIWRRRYLKKKDRMYELGKGAAPSSVNVAGGAAGTNPYGTGLAGRPVSSAAPGRFMEGAAAGVLHEKPKKSKERKKWTVTERT